MPLMMAEKTKVTAALNDLIGSYEYRIEELEQRVMELEDELVSAQTKLTTWVERGL